LPALTFICGCGARPLTLGVDAANQIVEKGNEIFVVSGVLLFAEGRLRPELAA
jgi:hypothetical protein